MEKMLACCGITCAGCPAFLATQGDDDAKREEVACEWSAVYGAGIEKDDINCDGCLSSGRLFGHCSRCVVRACAMTKGVPNCAHCGEFVCNELESFFGMMPDDGARLALERIRKSLT